MGNLDGKTQPSRSRFLLINLRTFLIGTIGGYCGYALGIPLGWLLGAMVVTIPLAMAGVSMAASRKPRGAMIAVIGLMVGSAFTPEIAAQAPAWWSTLLGVGVYVVIVSIFGITLCWKIGRMKPATAAFCGMPGGLSEMVVIGPALGADVRSISLVHGTRLVVLIAIVPTALSIFGLVGSGATGDISRVMHWGYGLSVIDTLILLGCAVFGVMLGHRLHFPAASLTGPLLLSAIVHLTGLTDAHIPDIVIAAAQVVIGATIGQHFAGVERRVLLTGLAMGTILTVFSMSLAAVFAAAFESLFGIPFAIGLLALVPGGLPEMSLIAISLNADPAFVSVHHLFRVVMILMTAPILIPRWVRYLERRNPPA